MSKFFRELLTQLGTKEKAPDSNYYLFLLGTSVNFVEQPEQIQPPRLTASYIRGETFSYTAQATAKLLAQKGLTLEGHDKPTSANYAHAFHSDSVDVINGPDVGAFEAGDRIAKALLLSLQAIAKGQTTINLSGFSRGAVQAIVLTHELDRVRETLLADAKSVNKKTLAQILKESNSVPGAWQRSYTRDSLNKLLAEPDGINDDQELKQILLDGLEQLQVNLFLLDPVPGGNFAKIPIGWSEPTFYSLPEFVTKKLELVQQHETSNCFKAVIPQGMIFEVIPGSHGTGDGNQFDDNLGLIKAAKMDVSAVQDLVLQRWLEFMGLKANHAIDEPVAGHDALNQITQTYLHASAKERDQLLLNTYQRILDNYPAFIFLAGQCYSGLGQFLPQRHIHYHKHGSIPITDLHSHGNSEAFVNSQHVQLWISQKIAEFNFFEKPLEEQIIWLKDNFEAVFKAAEPIAVVDDLSASRKFEQNQVRSIIEMAKDQKQAVLLIEAVVTLSNTLILTYLRNHLSPLQLSICHDYFKQIIAILNDASQHQDVAEQFKKAIENGLTTNVDQHCRALFVQSQKQLEESTLFAEQIKQSPVNILSEEDMQALQLKQKNWLVNTQRLLGELEILAGQIDNLLPFCEQESLFKSLSQLTNAQVYNYTDKDELAAAIRRSIAQAITLLQHQSAVMLMNNPVLLNNRPEEIESEFFQAMCLLAKGMGAVLAEDIAARRAQELEQQNLLVAREDIVKRDGLLEQAYAEIAAYKDELVAEQQRHQHYVQSAVENSDELNNNITGLEEQLAAEQEHRSQWQSPQEQQNILKIAALQERTNLYLSHLQAQKSGGSSLDDKKNIVNRLKGILDDSNILPSVRLEQFEAQLNQDNAQVINAHRDPTWLRFFRDCIRIIAVAISGVGLYRLATGSPANFFRPSHGERFVEEIESTLKPQNDK